MVHTPKRGNIFGLTWLFSPDQRARDESDTESKEAQAD
jgi:hypothetical protein